LVLLLQLMIDVLDDCHICFPHLLSEINIFF
jgi:hypothetical protein